MQMFQHRFVHNEQQGVHAIDQSPLRKGFKPLRLYVYPDERTCILHVITIGGKDEQSADVQECARFANELQSEDEDTPPE